MKIHLVASLVFALTGFVFAGTADRTFEWFLNAPVTDFQVPLVLEEGVEDFTYEGFATSNGTDLRITDLSSGSLLPYEIEEWDTAGVSTVWVKVPYFSAKTVLRLTWGDEEAPQADATNIWTNMRIVYHLGRPQKDSSAWSLPTAISEAGTIDGPNGNAHVFGTEGRKLKAYNLPAEQTSLTNQFTLSCWLKLNSLEMTSQYVFVMLTPSGGQFALVYGFWSQRLNFFFAGDAVTSAQASTPLTIPDLNWHHVAYTYDGATIRVYLDGVQKIEIRSSFSFTTATYDRFFMGGATASSYYNGSLDEFRLENVCRPAAWIAAACETQAQMLPQNDRIITFSEYNRDSTLTNFPALVVYNERYTDFSENFYSTSLYKNGVRFRERKGTRLLPCEAELSSGDKGNESTYWVRIPRLTNNASIRMSVPFYSIPAQTKIGSYVNTNTWSKEFISVLHLNHNRPRWDSTGFISLGGSPSTVWSNYPTAYNGPSGRYLAMRTGTNYWAQSDFLNNSCGLSNRYTISFWAKKDASFMEKNAYLLQFLKPGDPAQQRAVITGYGNQTTAEKTSFRLWSENNKQSSFLPIPDGDWHFYAFSSDGTVCRGYRDGEVFFTDTKPYSLELPSFSGYYLNLGSSAKAANALIGALDEVRIESEPRSADWIYACYRNQLAWRNGVSRLNPPDFTRDVKTETQGSTEVVFRASLSCRVSSQLVFCWGGENGGTTQEGWEHSKSLGDREEGEVSCTVDGLSAGQVVYGRFFAKNTHGSGWSPLLCGRSAIPAFSNRVKITVSDYPGTEVLTNFPVCVRLGAEKHLPSITNALQFVSADGVQLPFETETWNPEGTSIFWVSVPRIERGTVIEARWGNSFSSDEELDSSTVFGSSYQRVFHMTPEKKDSSQFSANISPSSFSSATEGIIGPARTYTGKKEYPEQAAYEVFYDFANGFTLSLWAKIEKKSTPASLAQQYLAAAVRENCQVAFIYGWNGIDNVELYISENIKPESWSSTYWDSEANMKLRAYSVIPRGDSEWHQYVYSHDGLRFTSYKDGVQMTNVLCNVILGNVYPGERKTKLLFGGTMNITAQFFGCMDEYRCEKTGRSADWIAASYANEKGTLCSIGPVCGKGTIVLFR